MIAVHCSIWLVSSPMTSACKAKTNKNEQHNVSGIIYENVKTNGERDRDIRMRGGNGPNNKLFKVEKTWLKENRKDRGWLVGCSLWREVTS